MQAFADVIQNPEEAADIIVEANPEYASKKDVLVKQIEADIKGTFFSPETKAHGLGWMTSDAWSDTTRILLEQGAMKDPIKVDAAFDVKFLGRANAVKR
jgi:NitT/TauT family transport system substrate-binding protein